VYSGERVGQHAPGPPPMLSLLEQGSVDDGDQFVARVWIAELHTCRNDGAERESSVR
jgi:hypothetical protein